MTRVATFLIALLLVAPSTAQLLLYASSLSTNESNFQRELILNSGVVLYGSTLDDAPTNQDLSWWLGGLLVLQEGDPAPGLPGISMIPFDVLTDGGQLFYSAFLVDEPPEADFAVYLDDTMLARERGTMPAPGTPDLFGIGTNVNRAMNGGQIVFQWSLVEPVTGNDRGAALFKGNEQGISPAVRSGTAAPGLPGYDFGGFWNVVLSPSGRLAFIAFASDGTEQITGVWRTTQGTTLEMVARTGVPGPGNVGEIFSIDDISFAGTDELVIRVSTAEFPLPDNAAWITGGGGVVVTSDEIIDGSFTSFLTHTTGSPSKDLAFYAHLNDNRVALCLANAATGIEVIIAEGDPAPDAEPGVTVQSLSSAQPTLTEYGQMAFMVKLGGDGIDFSNEDTLYYRRSDGNLAMVAREGDTYDLGPFGLATINATAARPEALRFRDNGCCGQRHSIYDGIRSPMTKTGTIVFWARFLGAQEFEGLLLASPDPDAGEIIFGSGFEPGDSAMR